MLMTSIVSSAYQDQRKTHNLTLMTMARVIKLQNGIRRRLGKYLRIDSSCSCASLLEFSEHSDGRNR